MTEIYLDSAATSLHKPPQVARAVAEAICTAGNAARGAHGASMQASRTVYETRQKLARLLGCPRPDHVVFTSNSTTALNICDWDSAEVSDVLYADYGIATRPGAHCAPRLHEALGTVRQGAVRFSFTTRTAICVCASCSAAASACSVSIPQVRIQASPPCRSTDTGALPQSSR